jgi:hypothetical protein
MDWNAVIKTNPGKDLDNVPHSNSAFVSLRANLFVQTLNKND